VPVGRNVWPILAAGFMGMFLCGGPVYAAGVSTTAIHIALIMALSPITVLLISAVLGMEQSARCNGSARRSRWPVRCSSFPAAIRRR